MLVPLDKSLVVAYVLLNNLKEESKTYLTKQLL